MRTDTPPPVKLADYKPYPFAIDTVRLSFDLQPRATRVHSTLSVRRISDVGAALELNGEKLKLVSLKIDGVAISEADYEMTPEMLKLSPSADAFTLEIETEISPETNTELSGLYMSGGRFCTQCEAEGFRRITYYPDRPDVLSVFSVRIEAEAKTYPHLLSNGSPGDMGELSGGRHFAEWTDPHPKPAYLFALVAGDYDVARDTFTTRSGRRVPLSVYVDKGDADRAGYALDALKRSMAWDEDVWGREYDLDVFNIVAVRDFNFGAMENKGLNIFNSAYVLADGETATDFDFEAIEGIVAHEYFHNWTGNRITCRDWFQLCLKEGLTVYRDQEFSADMRSRAVCRIKDVIRLRARQFAEDAGPLSHPVRPDTYGRIDNLYTATVYEKGAELIRMLRTLIGDTAFFAGANRYFDTFDGQAATMEDFLWSFQQSTSHDLEAFARWYSQPGTPTVKASGVFDAAAKTYRLTLAQSTPPTPGQAEKQPVVIPTRTALFSANGDKLNVSLANETADEHVLVLDTQSAEFEFQNVPSAPLVSLNRGFSAPVRIEGMLNETDRGRLASFDDDPFAQWEAFQSIARALILDGAKGDPIDERLSAYLDMLESALGAASDDPAFAALLLRLPTVGELILDMSPADPAALHTTHAKIRRALGERLKPTLITAATQAEPAEFDASAASAGRRAFKSSAFYLLAALDEPEIAIVADAFESAATMTESLAALNALANSEGETFDDALSVFEAQWASAPLVMDKWYSAQAMCVRSDFRERLRALSNRKDFDLKNPNRVRALAAAFAMSNPVEFNAADGWGYKFLADMILEIDKINPALSARLATAYENWRAFTDDRREAAKAELERLSAANLSQNAQDIIGRALAT
ncbi:MAG: aminopeptidase N [Pseudomonadota bacterium]